MLVHGGEGGDGREDEERVDGAKFEHRWPIRFCWRSCGDVEAGERFLHPPTSETNVNLHSSFHFHDESESERVDRVYSKMYSECMLNKISCVVKGQEILLFRLRPASCGRGDCNSSLLRNSFYNDFQTKSTYSHSPFPLEHKGPQSCPTVVAVVVLLAS